MKLTASNIWNRIKIQYKFAFFSTLIFGIFSHGMAIFNKYGLHDDLNYIFNYDNPLPSGRWMEYCLIRLEKFVFGTSCFSLPVINGVLSIILIGITVCLLIDLLEIKSNILCVLLGGIMISVPSVAMLFADMYLSHFYSLALLLSVFGPYLILKHEKWYYTVAGIGLMTASTGIYQAYIPMMVSTFLFTAIKRCSELQNKQERAAFYKKLAVMVFCCLAFISLYFLITFTINNHLGIVMTGYKGFDTITNPSLDIYLFRLKNAYVDFFNPHKKVDFNILPGNTRSFYYAFLALLFILYGKLIFSRRKHIGDALLLFGMMLLIPLAVNFLHIMTDQGYFYMLMLYSKVSFFVILIWLIDKTLEDIPSLPGKTARAVCICALSLFLFMYSRYDNICYLRMDVLQKEATRYFTTLITRMQDTEGYDSWKHVAFIGEPRVYDNDNSIQVIHEFDDIVFYPYNELKNALIGPWKVFMRLWCGYNFHEADPSYFIDKPVVQDMPHYPEEGSIKVVDDVVVVKF